MAIQSFLSSTLAPLILHSLFSLPLNWTFLRRLLSAALPLPACLYRPELMRAEAREIVEANECLRVLWGMGGEVEGDEERQRRNRRALLEKGGEGWREREDEKRKEGKEEMKATFGRDKVCLPPFDGRKLLMDVEPERSSLGLRETYYQN